MLVSGCFDVTPAIYATNFVRLDAIFVFTLGLETVDFLQSYTATGEFAASVTICTILLIHDLFLKEGN